MKRIEFAPGNRVHAHPELRDRLLMLLIGTTEAFVSDETHLFDFLVEDDDEEDVLLEIEDEFGVELSRDYERLYLWMVVDCLAGAKPS